MSMEVWDLGKWVAREEEDHILYRMKLSLRKIFSEIAAFGECDKNL